ncbi:MAG: glycosyltransferase family 2 protein [Pseudomonadota bacterium]
MDEHNGMANGSDILISIVNYRTPEHCVPCLASLVGEREQLPGLKVVVADGASGDNSIEFIQSWIENEQHGDWITLLPLAINGGFGWAHNQVILRALQADTPPRFIHILNPDTVIEPSAVASLRRAFDNDPKAGAIGSQMINAEGGLQPAGFRLAGLRTEFARGANAGRIARLLGAKDTVIRPDEDTAAIEAVSGASFMVRATALSDVGLFDTGFFLYFEEFEWMGRFKRGGWKVAHEPRSRVHHAGGAATKLSRDRKVLAQSARPFYWYQSQRRFLYRTLGSKGARAAGAAWFLGHFLIALPRAFFSATVRRRMVKNEGRDMLRAWLVGERFDRQSHVLSPADPIDEPPAWQARQP